MPETDKVQEALGKIDELLRQNHAAFLEAIGPGSSDRAEIAQNIMKFLDHPDVTELLQRSHDAVMDLVNDPAALTGSRAFDDKHRAEAAFVKRTNSWKVGDDVRLLLQPTGFTNSENEHVQRSAQHVLTTPRLTAVLDQRYENGAAGKPVEIADLDGKILTPAELTAHPLLQGTALWDTLHSESMNALLRDPADALARFDTATLTNLAMAQRIATVAIHYAVRDSIKYGLGSWRQAASNVLRLRQGSCSGSANLGAALARAANVPAGVVITWVELPHYFYVIMTPNVLPTQERTSVHAHTSYVTLAKTPEGFAFRAVGADASDQAPMATAAVHDNYPSTRVVDFDGATESLLEFPPEFIYDRAGPILNIDPLLDKSSSIPPAPSERWQFLRFVAQARARKPDVSIDAMAEKFADLAERFLAEPWQEIHEMFHEHATAYTENVTQIAQDPALATVFPDKMATLLQQFLTSEVAINAVAKAPADVDVGSLVEGYRQFVGKRGVAAKDVQTAVQIEPFMRTLATHLSTSIAASVPADMAADFAQGYDVCVKFEKILKMGREPETRKAVFSQLFGRTYKFMEQCYPSNEASAAGPLEARRWLPKPEQTEYLNWVQGIAVASESKPYLEAMFTDPANTALAYLVKDHPNGYFNAETGLLTDSPQAIMQAAGISQKSVDRMSDFHEHLLSNISVEVMNRFLEYGSTKAESIRRSIDGVALFETWLARKHPQLADLHQEELQVNPQYSYTVYMYLLLRLPMNLPGPAEKTLGDFVRHMKAQNAPSFGNEAELDAVFAKYLSEDKQRVPLDAFVSRVPGGPMKPYGLLWGLVKAYILLPQEQSRGAIENLFAQRENRGRTMPRIDWFHE